MGKLPGFGLGFLVGSGAGFISGRLAGTAKDGVRPVVKGMLKSGLLVVEKGRQGAAQLGEMVEDLVAEIRSEAGQNEAKAPEGRTNPAPDEPAMSRENGGME